MTAPPADLETRVAVLEGRQQRTDEDLTSIMDTVLDTREDVRILRRDVGRLRLDFDGMMRKLAVVQNDVEGLKRKADTLQLGVSAILAHLGLTVEPDNRDS
jgi:chromosome segregation ATPase